MGLDMSTLIPDVPLKLCCQCEFVMTPRHNLDDNSRCGSPKNTLCINLVTGNKVYSETCGQLRSYKDNVNKCGQEGNWFKQYIQPAVKEPSPKEPAIRTPKLIDIGM